MNKILLVIRYGEGGDDAKEFAGQLAKMYEKYSLANGYGYTVLDAG
jgi:protein subunit release factor A